MNEHPSARSSKLFSPSGFRDLVSGRRRGPAAAALRGILAAAEVPYAWAVRWRNRCYDRGMRAVHRIGAPVISVGNLTLGGTGKTPMVEWIARWFLARGRKVGIVSRGYGLRSGPNDEARELAWKLPGVPHVQDPDRVAAARRATRGVRLPGPGAGRRLPASPHRPRPGYRAPGRLGAFRVRTRLSPRHAPRTVARAGPGGCRRLVAGRSAHGLRARRNPRPRRPVVAQSPMGGDRTRPAGTRGGGMRRRGHRRDDRATTAAARCASRPASDSVLRAGKPGRVPAHARRLRLRRGRVPRVPRSPRLSARRTCTPWVWPRGGPRPRP